MYVNQGMDTGVQAFSVNAHFFFTKVLQIISIQIPSWCFLCSPNPLRGNVSI